MKASVWIALRAERLADEYNSQTTRTGRRRPYIAGQSFEPKALLQYLDLVIVTEPKEAP